MSDHHILTLTQPALAIAPIRSAMLRLDPSTGTFTSAHVNFMHLCLETRSYAAAVPILDNYIHSLPSSTPAAVRDAVEYSVPCADSASSGDYITVKSGHSAGSHRVLRAGGHGISWCAAIQACPRAARARACGPGTGCKRTDARSLQEVGARELLGEQICKWHSFFLRRQDNIVTILTGRSTRMHLVRRTQTQ
jgi:hypothetical protein